MFHSVKVKADNVADQGREVFPVGGVRHRKGSFFGVQSLCPLGLGLPGADVALMAIERSAVARAGDNFHAAGRLATSPHESQPEKFQAVIAKFDHDLLDRYFAPPGEVFRVHGAKVSGAGAGG